MKDFSDAPSRVPPAKPRRFYGTGAMSKRYYEVGADYIRRKRPFDVETLSGLPADEISWANTRKRAEALFFWHRNNGLERAQPHPMGKDLGELRAEKNAYHADRYRQAGMAVPGCYLESGTHDGSSPQNQDPA